MGSSARITTHDGCHFRHFFRHAYAASIEYAQLQINLDKAQRLHPDLRRDVERFLRRL